MQAKVVQLVVLLLVVATGDVLEAVQQMPCKVVVIVDEKPIEEIMVAKVEAATVLVMVPAMQDFVDMVQVTNSYVEVDLLHFQTVIVQDQDLTWVVVTSS